MWPHVLHQEQYKAYRQFFKDDYSNYGVLEFLDIKYILSTTELSDTAFALQERVGEVYIYRFDDADSLGYLYTDVLPEEEFEALPEGQRSSVLSSKIVLANNKTSSIPFDENAAPIKQPIELQLINDGYLIGSYSSSGEAIGAISIPFNKGWTVRIDGEAVESFVANYGFIGFDVEPGSHTLELRYEPAGWKTGLILSCVGAVLFMLQIVYWKRSKRPAHAK